MPVLRSIRERFARERPLDGVRGGGLPARDRRDGQPDARAGGRRGARPRCARPTRCPRRTTWRRRWPTTACRCTPRAARTSTPTPSTWARWRSGGREITLDDGADLLTLLHALGAPTVHGRRRGDHHRAAAPAPARGRGRLRCPVLAVNESRTERTFNDRYGTGQSALDGILRATNLLLAGPHARAARLRLHRQGDRPARPRRRRRRDRLRGRPAARARGAHGRLRGDARARGRRARRPVRDRHRLARRAARASTSSA